MTTCCTTNTGERILIKLTQTLPVTQHRIIIKASIYWVRIGVHFTTKLSILTTQKVTKMVSSF